MNKELKITKEDLILWLDRPPTDYDLELCAYLENALENQEKYYNQIQKLQEKFKATNKGLRKVLSKRLKWKRRYYKEKYIRKELKKWLEEVLNGLKENDVYDRTSYEIGQIVVIESIIAKIEELEEGVK